MMNLRWGLELVPPTGLATSMALSCYCFDGQQQRRALQVYDWHVAGREKGGQFCYLSHWHEVWQQKLEQ